MDQNQPPNLGSSLFQLNLDASNSAALRSAASWAKVLAICGIIISILCFIVGILIQTVITTYNRQGYLGNESGSSQLLANAGMAVYLILGIILLLSSIFALNFGNKINRALRSNDQLSLSAGFAGLRNYFALWAIIMIISLLLMIISVAGLATSR